MNKLILLVAVLFSFYITSFGQDSKDKIIFIVDSIAVIDDPEDGNEKLESDISDMKVIKNKDTLKQLG